MLSLIRSRQRCPPLSANGARERQANGVFAGTNQRFRMVQTSGLDAHEHLAGFQRGQILNADLNYLRTASAERTTDPPLSNRAHHEETYHQTLADR
jgi:hypothetical protein